jgi:uncharacterized membrane protein
MDLRLLKSMTRSPLQLLYEALALSGFGFGLAMVIYKWSVLPNLIPTHFGVSGLADDWSRKRWILALPAISSVLYLILTWLRRYQYKLNYLWQITERNAQRQYYLAASVVDLLKAELMWLFGWITWQTVRVALGQATGLGVAFVPIVLIVVGGTAIGYLYVASQDT